MQMDDAFGHWLAGFTDGEGSFCIYRRERGVRQCHEIRFSLSLRDDDQSILRDIFNATSVGRISHVKRSWDGVRKRCNVYQWQVGGKADAFFLAELFRLYPLRSKKARDSSLWCKAATLMACYGHLSKGKYSAVHPVQSQMARLKFQIESVRRYQSPDAGSSSQPSYRLDDSFGNWLAGFVDAEGCFSICKNHVNSNSHVARFTLSLRDDDVETLHCIVRTTGLGNVHRYTPKSTKTSKTRPVAVWSVTSESDVFFLTK
jgi:hypothetical protein